MAVIEGAGVALAYEEDGDGPAIVIVHGLAADAAAWAPTAQALAGAARVVRYDRRGYGGSGAPEPYGGTTVEEQAEDAAAVLRRLGAHPAIVVGDGFGALVALDLAKRHAALVRGLVLREPPLYMFVAAATEALAAERLRIEEAVRDRGPEAGVDAWLAGRGERAANARARRAYRAFFADYAGLAGWPVTRADLRALQFPTVVVTGPQTTPATTQAADVLVTLLPQARRAHDDDTVGAARSLAA